MSTRFVRPGAVAPDGGMVTGWNIAPNIDYVLMLAPSPSACAVQLLTPEQQLIATGAAPTGADQPCTLFPAAGQTLGMVDPGLGWHLRLSTAGAELPQIIAIAPHSDLPDVNHPAYSDDALSLARARAEIDRGTHATEELTVFSADFSGALGDIVSVGVNGGNVIGQLMSIVMSGSPDGTSVSATIRSASAITPSAAQTGGSAIDAVDDTGETDAATVASGNVLDNDSGSGLITVAAVNGVAGDVGQVVDGSTGGQFVIQQNGWWEFDPAGDFAGLAGDETATTSLSYTVTDGMGSDSATLAVTVSSAAQQLWTPAEIPTALWLDAADSSTITLNGATVSEWRDKSGHSRHATQVTASRQPVSITNGVQFDGSSDFLGFSTAIVQNITTLILVIAPTIEPAVGFVFGQFASGVSGRLGLVCNQACSGSTSAGRMNPFHGGSTNGACSGGYTADFSITNAPIIVGVTCAIPGSENWRSYKNGNLQDSATVTVVASSINSALGSVNAGDASYPYDGIIREVVALHAVDDAERQKIEGYLAHKWDALLGVTTLVSALSSTHPYKSAAP